MRQAGMPASPAAELQQPRFETGKPLLIAGLRSRYTAETMNNISAQWQRFQPYIGKISGPIGRAAYGVCWQACDGEGVDYLSGVEVCGFSGLPSEFTVVSIPEQRYAVFSHREHVSMLRNTIEAIFRQWLPESAQKVACGVAETPDFLERHTDEFDPRTGMGGMEVWIPIES